MTHSQIHVSAPGHAIDSADRIQTLASVSDVDGMTLFSRFGPGFGGSTEIHIPRSALAWLAGVVEEQRRAAFVAAVVPRARQVLR